MSTSVWGGRISEAGFFRDSCGWVRVSKGRLGQASERTLEVFRKHLLFLYPGFNSHQWWHVIGTQLKVGWQMNGLKKSLASHTLKLSISVPKMANWQKKIDVKAERHKCTSERRSAAPDAWKASRANAHTFRDYKCQSWISSVYFRSSSFSVLHSVWCNSRTHFLLSFPFYKLHSRKRHVTVNGERFGYDKELALILLYFFLAL